MIVDGRNGCPSNVDVGSLGKGKGRMFGGHVSRH